MPHRFIAHMKTHICGNIYTNEIEKVCVIERERKNLDRLNHIQKRGDNSTGTESVAMST